ncbi:MAG TPA: VWA domain-containing protein [Vicinamibacterales bacterium]|nr:VWA domain-containing protein [Vicinamibacterales bacterium]
MRAAIALVALCAASALLSAQTPAPPQGPDQPTFRAGVTLVTTDAIPRDPDGRFVPDLAKDDFVVLEDGVEQKIESFVLVHGGRTFNLLQAPSQVIVPEGIVLPPTRRPPDTSESGRILVIFIDDLHFEPEYTPHVRRIVRQLAETLMHDGDLVAMVSSGPSAIEIEPTLDRKLIISASERIRGSAPNAAEIFKMLETSSGPGDIRYRAQVAFQTMYSMVGSLDQVRNRRKAVLYISPGYDLDPFALGRASKDHIMGGRYSDPMKELIDQENPYFKMGAITADVDLFLLMKELTLTANRANATLFTIDPRGLAGVVDASQYLDQSDWRTFLQKTQSSLRFLAEETGGFAVVNDNDFEGAFKRIDALTSDYYVLGYYSSNPDPTRRVRSLEISVQRPGVVVAARKEYSLKTPGAPVPVKAPPSRKK